MSMCLLKLLLHKMAPFLSQIWVEWIPLQIKPRHSKTALAIMGVTLANASSMLTCLMNAADALHQRKLRGLNNSKDEFFHYKMSLTWHGCGYPMTTLLVWQWLEHLEICVSIISVSLLCLISHTILTEKDEFIVLATDGDEKERSHYAKTGQ